MFLYKRAEILFAYPITNDDYHPSETNDYPVATFDAPTHRDIYTHIHMYIYVVI